MVFLGSDYFSSLYRFYNACDKYMQSIRKFREVQRCDRLEENYFTRANSKHGLKVPEFCKSFTEKLPPDFKMA
jgi:hypothetical protein